MTETHPVQKLWHLGNQPLFTNADLLELGAPHLSRATLQNWANRGLVDPTIEVRNVKGRRRYSAVQLQSVVLGLPFTKDFGMPPEEAFLEVAGANLALGQKLLRGGIKKARQEEADLVKIDLSNIDDYWIVSPGDGKPEAYDISDLPSSFNQKRHCLVYPFGAALHDLARRAAQIREDLF